MHLSHQPTNYDIGILDIIMGFVILLRFTRQEFYYGLLDMTHVKVLLYHGVTTYITPSLDNLWGQWRIGICSIITRAFIVATPLWPSVGVKPNTPKVGDLESSGTPECLGLASKA